MGDRRHDIVGQRILNSGALCQEDPFLGEFFQPKFSSFSVERCEIFWGSNFDLF